MSAYQHTKDVIALPPRKIAAHLRDDHGVEPKAVLKGYERGNWSWQHECLHKDAPGGTNSTVAGRQLSPGGTNLAGRQNLSESTLALGVGIDYDTGMRTTEQWAAEDTCPWCGEADPGEQSGITTCCAEAVIGPAEAQLAKGAK